MHFAIHKTQLKLTANIYHTLTKVQ